MKKDFFKKGTYLNTFEFLVLMALPKGTLLVVNDRTIFGENTLRSWEFKSLMQNEKLPFML